MKFFNIHKNHIKHSYSFNRIFNILFILVISTAPSFALQSTTKSLIKANSKEIIDEVWQIVYRDYLDSSGSYNPKKWILLRKKLLSAKYSNSQDSYIAIKDMLSKLNDPYTRFLNPSEFKEMRIDTSGQLMGVGIQISLDKETDNLVVVSPIEGTPAFKAGIKPKDVIVSIDGNKTKGLSIEKAVKLIRGERGTSVTLGVLRNSRLIKFRLIRERIEINTVKSFVNKTQNGINIGYIRLKQFNANAAKEMTNSIRSLESQNTLGYVLDLRGNPGGLLESSIEIARLLIHNGIIVSTQTRDGINDVRLANGTSLTNKPIAVLVNEGSASASEILSGAIRDNGRGFLVGKTTFGKGLVQSVRSLSDGSGLTVTVAKYLTPKGIDINKNGLKPDIEAFISRSDALRLTSQDLGTLKDTQYVVAETELVRKISQSMNKSSYLPNTSNLIHALKY
tara:strand:+ start:20971 stop:22320 length:1350 start_codon:yes stop_codon:yes gene_type:complete